MKMVYTSENRFFVLNAKNILDQNGIKTTLKNEFSAGAIGELSAFDVWLELWVVNDAHCDLAYRILEGAFGDNDATDWLCQQCSEHNHASFDFCWNCQQAYS